MVRRVQANSASQACKAHSVSIMNSRGTLPEPTVSASTALVSSIRWVRCPARSTSASAARSGPSAPR